MADRDTSRRMWWLLGFLAVVAAYSAVWPAYRAFLPIEVNQNESWNAYYDDKAIRGDTLYPPPDGLLSNNYPPLSFYIVGGVGHLLGDTILAGRLLSLAAIGLIGWGVGRMILLLNGSRLAAWVGGLLFVATMFRFLSMYAGMNDPQLLAQAVMLFGFTAFLKAVDRDRGYLLPIIVMVVAGFVKHNIVMMPLVAFVWLAIQRPKRLLPWGGFALLLVAAGFAICRTAYGPDFVPNLLTPRVYELSRLARAMGGFQWHAVGLVAWLYVGVARRREPAVKLCNLLVAAGVLSYLAQSTGEGVGDNAQFDMLIAVSVAVGVAFAQAPHLPLTRLRTPEQLRTGLLLGVCLRLVAPGQFEPVRLVFDPSFREEIAIRVSATHDAVEKVRATPGDVVAPGYVTYLAGKRQVVDSFNVWQRTKTGALPADAVDRRVAAGEFVRLEFVPLFNWSCDLPK